MEKKARRKRRTDHDIEAEFERAAIRLIEEVGFSGLTVRGLTQRAKAEPIVFYKRYKDLAFFIDEFVKKYDYWLSDVTKKSDRVLNDKELYISLLSNLHTSLKENKLMQQLLRWELACKNDTTQRTAMLREIHTLPLVKKYKALFADSPVEIEALSALIIGGIYYLILHADLSPFSGIDIRTEEGNKQVRNAIAYLGETFFAGLSPDSKTLEIAKRMKADGMDAASIAKYTNLPIHEIKKL